LKTDFRLIGFNHEKKNQFRQSVETLASQNSVTFSPILNGFTLSKSPSSQDQKANQNIAIIKNDTYLSDLSTYDTIYLLDKAKIGKKTKLKQNVKIVKVSTTEELLTHIVPPLVNTLPSHVVPTKLKLNAKQDYSTSAIDSSLHNENDIIQTSEHEYHNNNSFFKPSEKNDHLTRNGILGGGIGLSIGAGVAVGFGLAATATSSLLVAASVGVGVCLFMLALVLIINSVYQPNCASPSNS
jgi:hypothetical protein